MTMQIDQGVAYAVLGFILALIGFFLRRILNSLDELVEKVGAQNGRVGKLEEWKQNFKEEVRERFDRLEER